MSYGKAVRDELRVPKHEPRHAIYGARPFAAFGEFCEQRSAGPSCG